MNAPHAGVFIGLGSNLGDRLDNLRLAVNLLEEKLDAPSSARSRILETDPVGPVTDQPAFLNAVIRINVHESPETVLQSCLHVEDELGRVRCVPGGPRTIDVDLLLYGKVTRDDDRLQLPHPRLHLRRFVLAPLAELAPELVHPTIGDTMADLLAKLPADGPQVRVAPMVW